MGTHTPNLNLYNTDMNTDGNDTFDFQRDLNDNNNKIDSAIGKLSNLTTEQQANLVSAINEIVSNLDGKTSKSLNDLNAVGQAILDKKVEVEALLAQNGYAKFSWKENNEISILLCWGNCSIYTSITTINLPLSYTTTYFVFLQSTYHKTNIGNLVTSCENTGTKKLSSFQARTNTQHASDWFTIGY